MSTPVDDSEERTALLQSHIHVSRRDSFASSLQRLSTADLPPAHNRGRPTINEQSSTLAIWIVVPISLIGILIAHADGSLVVASSQQIASEFNALSDAQWLVTTYLLAQCASQPLYGKLSDVFGRKANLVAAYIFFAVGCFLCGIGRLYWQVVMGRVLSGIGGAGLTALVSVVISDMAPVRSVAAWRSYVNIAAATGRAIGGPVGGWLCDTIGWRWSFFGQIPISILGMILILWKMPTNTSRGLKSEESLSEKYKRIDVLGAISLVAAITTFLLLLDSVSARSSSTFIIFATALFFLFTSAFYHIETTYAREPIIPIRLLTARPALTSYLLSGLQVAGQFGFYYATPIYFQIVAHNNVAQAGLHLVPAVVGNAIAGLLAGYVISKTGRYRLLTISSCILGLVGYVLITVRWRARPVSWPEALYLFLGGFAAGGAQSTTFIHLAASLDHADMAIAGTTIYLAQNIFLLIGIQSATTVTHLQLRSNLDKGLRGEKDRAQIIEMAMSSVDAIRTLPKHVRHIVESGYIDSLTWAFGTSCIPALLALLVALTVQERRLD